MKLLYLLFVIAVASCGCGKSPAHDLDSMNSAYNRELNSLLNGIMASTEYGYLSAKTGASWGDVSNHIYLSYFPTYSNIWHK